jgi:hypothetical protein
MLQHQTYKQLQENDETVYKDRNFSIWVSMIRKYYFKFVIAVSLFVMAVNKKTCQFLGLLFAVIDIMIYCNSSFNCWLLLLLLFGLFLVCVIHCTYSTVIFYRPAK